MKANYLRSIITIFGALLFSVVSTFGVSPWGKDYFPNTILTDQDGKKVRFFEDLIKDKIVVINFIYTSCPDTCPLETAQLVKVQEILGDRLGRDIFFYSISLDPEIDTPPVLKEYREKFNAKWTFLTGGQADVWELQKKLGLFLEEIKEGLEKHNVNMIIGNQKTGRWMKRSPHENPYVLADQVGNWLDGWKRPPQLEDYDKAPKLRDLPRGEQLFRTRCAACHTIQGHDSKNAIGPDLLGVVQRREMGWLLNWLRAPNEMLAKKDPIAMALYEKYNKLAMPNLRINRQEAEDLIKFLNDETKRVIQEQTEKEKTTPVDPKTDYVSADGLVEISKAWVRKAHPAANSTPAYLTLTNTSSKDLVLTKVESKSFDSVALSKLFKVDGSMKRSALTELLIPAGKSVDLKSIGPHLMLQGRHEDIDHLAPVELALIFESDVQKIVTLPVGKPSK